MSRKLRGQPYSKAQCVSLPELLATIRACRVCAADLPLGPRPLLQVAKTARVLLIGQAPGRQAHQSGIPWNDLSGMRLRQWMGIDEEVFYDASRIAIIPMGYCYPGTGQHGDLPPRRECSDLWLKRLLEQLPYIELTLLIGAYAQRHFLADSRQSPLTETVKRWQEYAPRYFPLPHPSPRNQGWLKKNPWFEQQLLPELRLQISSLLKQ